MQKPKDQKESQKIIRALLFVVVFSMGFNLKLIYSNSKIKKELEISKQTSEELSKNTYNHYDIMNELNDRLNKCLQR